MVAIYHRVRLPLPAILTNTAMSPSDQELPHPDNLNPDLRTGVCAPRLESSNFGRESATVQS